jgi:hypothetical protein
MDLAEMRTRLRRELKDEDPASYRWSDDELDRHIARAVAELSLAVPLQSKATLTTTAGSRELSLSTLADLVATEAVEYPTGKYPPDYVLFSLWGDTLTLLVDQTPGDGEQVAVYYGKLHTLDATTSTLPPPLEELVAAGAAGYAALEWANYAINRVNTGGEAAWRGYLTWAQERLAAFHQGLARHSRRNTVRVRRLYRPYEPKPSQSTDWGP